MKIVVVGIPERNFDIYCRMVDEGMANEAVRRIVRGQPLSEILDKISAEIREAREDLDGYEPNALITFADRVDDIIEKYKGVSE